MISTPLENVIPQDDGENSEVQKICFGKITIESLKLIWCQEFGGMKSYQTVGDIETSIYVLQDETPSQDFSHQQDFFNGF